MERIVNEGWEPVDGKRLVRYFGSSAACHHRTTYRPGDAVNLVTDVSDVGHEAMPGRVVAALRAGLVVRERDWLGFVSWDDVAGSTVYPIDVLAPQPWPTRIVFWLDSQGRSRVPGLGLLDRVRLWLLLRAHRRRLARG